MRMADIQDILATFLGRNKVSTTGPITPPMPPAVPEADNMLKLLAQAFGIGQYRQPPPSAVQRPAPISPPAPIAPPQRISPPAPIAPPQRIVPPPPLSTSAVSSTSGLQNIVAALVGGNRVSQPMPPGP